MNEFIKSLIDEAHVNLLNHNSDESVRQLKSIKLRLSDDGLLGRMQQKENNIDQEYQMKYKTLDKDDDVAFVNQLMALKEWRAKEYLVFYNRIGNEIP